MFPVARLVLWQHCASCPFLIHCFLHKSSLVGSCWIQCLQLLTSKTRPSQSLSPDFSVFYLYPQPLNTAQVVQSRLLWWVRCFCWCCDWLEIGDFLYIFISFNLAERCLTVMCQMKRFTLCELGRLVYIVHIQTAVIQGDVSLKLVVASSQVMDYVSFTSWALLNPGLTKRCLILGPVRCHF